MAAPLSGELRSKHGVSGWRGCRERIDASAAGRGRGRPGGAARAARESALPLAAAQVRSVPIRKDDEVTVVRGTYKVRAAAGRGGGVCVRRLARLLGGEAPRSGDVARHAHP